MDEPRPRHQTRRLPLIIERPDLAHPLRRVLALFATSLAWLLWLAMWIPFLAALGRHLGYPLPAIAFPSQVSLDSFFALLRIGPYVVGCAVAVVALSYLREKTRPVRTDERWRPIGTARLATGAALDPDRLAEWQTAQILYVAHGPHGRVSSASSTAPRPPLQATS